MRNAAAPFQVEEQCAICPRLQINEEPLKKRPPACPAEHDSKLTFCRVGALPFIAAMPPPSYAAHEFLTVMFTSNGEAPTAKIPPPYEVWTPYI